MLQHLMRMYNIEACFFYAIKFIPLKYISNLESHVRDALVLCVFSCLLDDFGGGINGIDEALWDARSKINADGAWATAHIEYLERRVVEVRKEMRTGVLDGTPAVGAEDGCVMAV
jgi:hypothetical protein